MIRFGSSPHLDWSCAQFYAIEVADSSTSRPALINFQIARNRLGLNDAAHELAKESAAKEKAEAEAEERKKSKKNKKA